MKQTKIALYIFIPLFFILFQTANANAETCTIPKPFKTVTLDEKKLYNLDNILALTEPLEKSQTLPFLLLKDQKKIPTLVSFWASWCKPCRDELPFLQSISNEKLANVILINIGDEKEDATSLLAELNVNSLTTLFADDKILSQLSFLGLPVTLSLTEKEPIFIGLGRLRNETTISKWLACQGNK